MLISVIIPIYNVSEYLPKCLESVLNQSYKDIEIICIEDCSTDNSREILAQYQKKDSRIKIIENNTNIGVGLSRNKGLNLAKGEYIHFLDPDDWMEENAYEILINNLSKTNFPDIIRFRFRDFNNQTKKFNNNSDYISENYLYRVFSITSYPEAIKYWSTSMCNKIIKTKFLKNFNIFFNNNKSQEDIEIAFKVLIKAKTIFYINDFLLNYRTHRKNSLTTKRIYYIDNLINDAKFVDKISKEFSQEIQYLLKDSIWTLLLINSLDAYYSNCISFHKLEEVAKIIDYKILTDQYLKKICININQTNSVRFFISYKIKRFIRQNFPIFTNLYFRIKNKQFLL